MIKEHPGTMCRSWEVFSALWWLHNSNYTNWMLMMVLVTALIVETTSIQGCSLPSLLRSAKCWLQLQQLLLQDLCLGSEQVKLPHSNTYENLSSFIGFSLLFILASPTVVPGVSRTVLLQRMTWCFCCCLLECSSRAFKLNHSWR